MLRRYISFLLTRREGKRLLAYDKDTVHVEGACQQTLAFEFPECPPHLRLRCVSLSLARKRKSRSPFRRYFYTKRSLWYKPEPRMFLSLHKKQCPDIPMSVLGRFRQQQNEDHKQHPYLTRRSGRACMCLLEIPREQTPKVIAK